MAADAQKDIIKYSDLFDPNAVSQLADEFTKVIPTIEEGIKKMATNLNKSLSMVSFAGMDLKQLRQFNEEIKKTNELSLLNAKLKKAEALANAAIEKQKQEAIKTGTEVIKQIAQEAKAEQELSKQKREGIKTTQTQLQVDEKKQKSDSKQIQLTDKEIAQKQVENQRKKDEITLLKATIVEMSKTAGWLQKIEAQNTRLRIERKRLVETDKDYATNLKRINEQLDANNAKIISNSDKLKQQKLNVGNYTESINKAFEGTGLLGETISNYLGVVENLAQKIESVVEAIVAQTVATKTNTAATEINNAAESANVALTEADTVATRTNTVATEANTVATEAQTAANNSLGKSLGALASNPYVIAAAAVAILTKVVYDNITATDENRDKIHALTEAAKEYASTALVLGVDSRLSAISVGALTLQLEKLEDKRIDNIVAIQDFKTAAAEAREDAAEEGKTIRDRIILLDEFINKSKEAFKIEIEAAQGLADAYNIFEKTSAAAGKELTDEQREQIQNARANVKRLRQEEINETIKTKKQQTALIKQYYDETLKLQQEAQRKEIELTDAYSKYRAEQLIKERDKQIKLNNLDAEQAITNLKKQQEELGSIGPDGLDRTEQFLQERNTLQRFYDQKNIEITRSTNLEIEKLNEDFRLGQVEAQKKFQEDLRKLDENYVKITNDLDRQQQENQLQQGQTQINRVQEQIKDLQNQRTDEIAAGKKQRNLTIKDLQTYFDTIDKLSAEQFERNKRKRQDDADFAKFTERQQTQEQINGVKERYNKLREEEAKAISNKTTNKTERKAQIESNNARLAKEESEEIERINRELAQQLALIEEKLKGDLSKADEEELKRQRAVLEEKRKIINQEVLDRKKANKEIIDGIKKASGEIITGIAKGLDQRAKVQEEYDNREIQQRERNIALQAQLAANGKENILAAEQARLDKAEAQRIENEKKAAQVQKNLTIIRTFSDTLSDALKSDKPFLQAFGEATAASGLVESAFAKLFSYYDGTEDTGTVAKPLDNNGGRLSVLHDNERVLPKVLNNKLEGVSNEQLVGDYLLYKQIYQSGNVSTPTHKVVNHDSIMTRTLSAKIDNLSNIVMNRPTSNTSLSGLGEWTETIHRNGVKTIIHHKGKRPLSARGGGQ